MNRSSKHKSYMNTGSTMLLLSKTFLHVDERSFFMVALCNRADHYIFPCDFYLLFFLA